MTAHPIDTEALRRLADAATEGPWKIVPSVVTRGAFSIYGVAPVLRARYADAEYMVSAANAVPALLDENAALRARLKAVERLTYASDDGTKYEHNGHGPAEGEPECPGCWALDIRRALDV